MATAMVLATVARVSATTVVLDARALDRAEALADCAFTVRDMGLLSEALERFEGAVK